MHSRTIAGVVVAALFLLSGANVRAAGPTSEDEAWGDLDYGRHPLVLSGDGHWRVHLDGDNRLHRAHLDGTIDDTLALPVPALALSASRDARTVVFATRNRCIGVADFAALAALRTALDDWPAARPWPARVERAVAWLAQAFAKPPLRWLKTKPVPESAETESCPSGDDARPIGGESEAGMTAHPRVAVSADGRLVALGGWSYWNRTSHLSVIDIGSGEVVRQLPSEGTAVQLRFIDDDRALYAEEAVLGAAYEGSPSPSDLRFAVWDLRNGALRNFVARKPSLVFVREDFLSDFSTSGHVVRMMQVDADRRDLENPALTLRLRYADLGHCGAAFDAGWTLPQAGWYAMAADPGGAWIAALHEVQDDGNNRQRARLVLFDAHTGRELHGFDVDEPLRSLAVSPDGRTLFATTRSEYRMKDDGEPELVRKGGDVRRFDVGEFTAAPTRADDATPACTIEDERPGARDVTIDDSPRPVAWTRDLLTLSEASRIAGSEHRPTVFASPERDRCGPNWDVEMRRTWGVADDGTVWLDRYDRLERIDPVDGHPLASIATPRGKDRCVVAWYAGHQFVAATDDAVVLQPFDGGGTRVLATRPGWRALAIEERDSHLLVRWADVRYLGKSDEPPAGSAAGVLYDLATGGTLAEYPGRYFGEQGSVVLDAEADDAGEYVDPFAAFATTTQGEYVWRASYYGSVRAVARHGGTALWARLHLDGGGELDAVPDVRGLGGSLGAAIWMDRVEIYDAEKRSRVARLPFASVVQVKWHAASGQVFLEPVGDGRLVAVPVR